MKMTKQIGGHDESATSERVNGMPRVAADESSCGGNNEADDEDRDAETAEQICERPVCNHQRLRRFYARQSVRKRSGRLAGLVAGHEGRDRPHGSDRYCSTSGNRPENCSAECRYSQNQGAAADGPSGGIESRDERLPRRAARQAALTCAKLVAHVRVPRLWRADVCQISAITGATHMAHIP